MTSTTVRTMSFAPGTNLKYDQTGASWAYLLPSQELEHAVVLGAPSLAALETLARVARAVTVYAGGRGRLALAAAIEQRGLGRVHLAQGTLAGRHADLLVAQGPRPPAAAEWLRPGGVLYYERVGLGAPASPALPHPLSRPLVVRETPLSGEVRTAVPVGDWLTAAYLRRRGLDAVSLTGEHVDRAEQVLRLAPAALRRHLRFALRAGAAGLITGPQRGERLLVGRGVLGRYGVLARSSAWPEPEGPPQYLAEIARSAGLDIGRCRWGLAARGEYRSQKVLMLLFDEGRADPTYIVKLTRDPAFNWRLENERRALETLRSAGCGDAEVLARPAFFGHHGGLAVLGETMVGGVPFHQRTTGDAACPLARSVIDWLLSLAEATAVRARPEETAAWLEDLREQFVRIYRPEPQYARFLAEQAAAVGASDSRFPLVFQCGDVGPWNALVTPSGRVAFTDWEAADVRGMPLWDLFYFMRSYAVLVARRGGVRRPLEGVERQLLAETPLSAVLLGAVREYCARIDLRRELAGPLFYTCWMYWALRESLSRPQEELAGGRYYTLLRRCIDRRDAPTLRALGRH
ncbi:MAG: hypothetical protein RLZZ387_4617 [Chloroflexota bacterium]